MESIKTLAEVIYMPQRAFARIWTQPRLGASGMLALLVSMMYLLNRPTFLPRHLARFLWGNMWLALWKLFFLAMILTPILILVSNMLDQKGGAASTLRRHYRRVLSATFYAWASSHLVMFVPALLLFGKASRAGWLALQLAPLPYFGLLMVIAISRGFQLTTRRSLAVFVLSIFSVVLLPLAGGVLQFVLASPLLLLLLVLLVRNYFRQALTAQRAQQRLERHLEAATINPLDSSAHYNLALLYEQRGQLDQAVKHFQRSIEIDPDEVDAHYRLGRIAREQGRLSQAISHFDATVRRDPDHAHSEVWREIGQTYLAAGQLEDARMAFTRFLEKRPHDANGLYHMGLLLDKLGERQKAVKQMQRVIEVVKTSPQYKYRLERRWMNQAKDYLNQLGG